MLLDATFNSLSSSDIFLKAEIRKTKGQKSLKYIEKQEKSKELINISSENTEFKKELK